MTTTDLAAHHAGKDSSRATITVALQVGLINIPLAIYKGYDDESRVKRSTFTADGHPLGAQPYDKVTLAPYTGPVVKKIEHGDGWVDLSDDEVESVLGEGVKGVAEVVTFVPLEAIGREYKVLDSQQARPAKIEAKSKKMDNPATVKSYTVMRAAMAAAGVAALAKVTMRTVTRYAAFTPDGQMHLLAYAEQVRAAKPLPEGEYTDREFDLATTMIRDVVGIDTPVLVDEDLAKLTAYVESKVAGGEVAKPAVDAPAPADDSQDLTALLELAVMTAAAKKAEKATVPA